MLVAFLGCAAVRAADAPIAGVLRIGTTGDYAPYSWYDADLGAYRGSDIALARALANELGLRPQFVGTSWSTLLDDARAGRFDIAVGGISITAERQQSVAFSTPYVRDRKVPVVRCGEQGRFDTQREIDHPAVRLIVNPGGTNERFSRAQFPNAALTVHADNRSVFDEIRAHRADVMVTDSVEARLQQRGNDGLCMAKVRSEWAPADKAVLVAAGAVTRHEVDAALARLGGKRAYGKSLSLWEEYGWADQRAPAVRMATLIDERLARVAEVARTKWNTQAPIEDPLREQQLIDALRARAAELGLSASTIERFFRAQIEAAKLLQRELFVKWRRQKQGPFSGVADLSRDIRPDIDRINVQLLETLALMSGSNSRMPAASTLTLLSPAPVRAARAAGKGT